MWQTVKEIEKIKSRELSSETQLMCVEICLWKILINDLVLN